MGLKEICGFSGYICYFLQIFASNIPKSAVLMRINVCECFCSLLITHFTFFLTPKLKISISRDFKISKLTVFTELFLKFGLRLKFKISRVFPYH